MYKIGLGYDIHQLAEGRDLIIGGLKIEHKKGLSGHSDADVLVHSIIDGMLGALALSDIGTLFPDTSDEFKNADSIELLKKVYALVRQKGYLINNIDSNIIAQAPKMMAHIPFMKENLAQVLDVEVDLISIKAKTNEKMDAVGRGDAIVANAIVMLRKEGI